jgi:hypothetical protein
VTKTSGKYESRVIGNIVWGLSRGRWDELVDEYGEKILLAIPNALGDQLRSQISDLYKEVKVGSVSLWSKRLSAD